MHDGIARISGYVQNLEVGSQGLRLTGELAAVHAGQHHITEQEIDAQVPLLQEVECRNRIGRPQDTVVEIAQGLDQIGANILVVLDDENGLAWQPFDDFAALRVLLVGYGPGRQSRQIDLHRRPLARLAVDLDVPLRLFDEPVDLTETEPGALAGRLGGEERLKRTHEHLSGHSDPVVGHGDQDILAAAYLGIGPTIVLVQKGVAGLDGELAAVRHGIAGVDREIEQRSLEFVRVNLHLPETGTADRLHFDDLTERALQELDLAGNEFVQVERLRI